MVSLLPADCRQPLLMTFGWVVHCCEFVVIATVIVERCFAIFWHVPIWGTVAAVSVLGALFFPGDTSFALYLVTTVRDGDIPT